MHIHPESTIHSNCSKAYGTFKKKFADSFEQIIMVINNIDWSNFDKNND
jgi:hypothetical protein